MECFLSVRARRLLRAVPVRVGVGISGAQRLWQLGGRGGVERWRRRRPSGRHDRQRGAGAPSTGGSAAGASRGGAGSGGSAGTSAAGMGGVASTAGAAVTAGSAGVGGSADLEPFSFFVTSLVAMVRLSGVPEGFGGDLRYGQTDGLAGADKICTDIAESSMPGSSRKQWRAFLSTSQVNAADCIGSGPGTTAPVAWWR